MKTEIKAWYVIKYRNCMISWWLMNHFTWDWDIKTWIDFWKSILLLIILILIDFYFSLVVFWLTCHFDDFCLWLTCWFSFQKWLKLTALIFIIFNYWIQISEWIIRWTAIQNSIHILSLQLIALSMSARSEITFTHTLKQL